jgi:hypothetical protein
MIIYFVFSAFISRPTSLLAYRRVSVFSFMVFTLSSNKLTLAAKTNPIQFQTDIIFLDFPDGTF